MRCNQELSLGVPDRADAVRVGLAPRYTVSCATRSSGRPSALCCSASRSVRSGSLAFSVYLGMSLACFLAIRHGCHVPSGRFSEPQGRASRRRGAAVSVHFHQRCSQLTVLPAQHWLLVANRWLTYPDDALRCADVVKSVAGSLIGGVIGNRWSNVTEIKEMTDPIFFVHGQRDTLIPWQHSQVFTPVPDTKPLAHDQCPLLLDVLLSALTSRFAADSV